MKQYNNSTDYLFTLYKYDRGNARYFFYKQRIGEEGMVFPTQMFGLRGEK